MHWSIRSNEQRYVLRRYASDRNMASILWELKLLDRLADLGAPVAPCISGPVQEAGSVYSLFPFMRGRAIGRGSATDSQYTALGRQLGIFHRNLAQLGDCEQRPDWRSYHESVLPPGGEGEKSRLLDRLARVEPGLPGQLERIAEEAALAFEHLGTPSWPLMPIHGDFSRRNLKMAGGKVVAVLDFDLAHMDVRAADVAFARRGSHDGVVDGYREESALTDAEVESLDSIWKGVILEHTWRILRGAEEHPLWPADLEWTAQQIAKTRPYRSLA